MLKPQDLLIVLKLAALQANSTLRNEAVKQQLSQLRKVDTEHLEKAVQEIDLEPDTNWTYRSLATATNISVSEVNAAIRRALKSQLLIKSTEAGRPKPVQQRLLDFIQHGVPYVYPAERGEPTRGILTAFAAPVMARSFASAAELPPVWRYAHGSSHGYSLSPIYRSAPSAAIKDPVLYAMLALVDVFRIGRQREKAVAYRELRDLLT